MMRKSKTADAHTLTEDDMAALHAAKKYHCVCSGGIHATPAQIFRLWDLGLIESIGGISYALTEKGKQVVGDNHDKTI